VKDNAATTEQTPTTPAPESFDLVRISKAKEVCDVAPNSIRNYAKLGLRIYRAGKSTFFSKMELAAFIKSGKGAVQS
jgi:hypothetical protein